MGYEYVAIAAFLIVSAALAYYTYTMSANIKGQDMKPATIDAFAITYCEEGTVLPLIYGTVRVPGNIMWFGNLQTTVSHANGPGQPIEGYYYRLDVWQGIGIGLLELVGMYAGDKACSFTNTYDYTPGAAPAFGITRTLTEDGRSQTVTYNPGDSAFYPTEPGENACPMNPVCHVFMDSWLMAMSATYLPTIHWVVKHRFPSWFPITGAEMANGDNPAAVIYDILLKAGETNFDLASFQTAADYWTTKGYGINISFSSQVEAKELIQTVFNYVDGICRQKSDGAWELIAYTDVDEAEYDIDTEDFVEFNISRNSWDVVPNYFIANYSDQDAEFSRRTVRLPISALISMLGYRRTKTIDLTAFRDVTTASARLWELGKRLSYPPISIAFKTDLRFHALQVGTVISVTHSDYFIVGADFRITVRNIEDLDKNLISFEAEQLMSTLFDGSFQVGGNPIGVTPVAAPDPLVYQKAFELPFIPAYGSYPPAFLVLGARPAAEDYFQVHISYDGGIGYSLYQNATFWAQRGTLIYDYLSGATGDIDLTFFREDPVFESVSDAAFPYTERFALVGNEIMRFQYVNPGTGDNDLILSTIIRGVFNTPVEDHTQDDEIWLFTLGDSIVLQGITAASFHLKFVPVSGSAVADISLCSAIPVTVTGVALGHSESASRSPSASASASA